MRKRSVFLFLCLITSVFAQNNRFIDYLNREINKIPLTSKGNELIRKHAKKYVDLYNSGLIYDFYTEDLIAQTVSWNLDTLPPNLKSQYWGWDNMKKLKTNLLGQINAEDVDTYNYLLTRIVLDFIKDYPKSIYGPTKTTKEEPNECPGIRDINDWMVNFMYGNADNFAWKFSQLKTESEVKKFIMNAADELIERYNSSMKNYGCKPKYGLKLFEIEESIAYDDWDKFLEASFAIGWSPQKYLITFYEINK